MGEPVQLLLIFSAQAISLKAPICFLWLHRERAGYSSRKGDCKQGMQGRQVMSLSALNVGLSHSLSLPPPPRGLKRGRGEFSESKLERQHEFGWTEKWLFKQRGAISLL